MTGPFTPLFHVVFFIFSLFGYNQRQEYFRAIRRFLLPLTQEQKLSVKKAKREAKQKFQPRRVALGRGQYRLAEPGELGGSRYQIYTTTMEDLGGFGALYKYGHAKAPIISSTSSRMHIFSQALTFAGISCT
jgi:hypothetical protein